MDEPAQSAARAGFGLRLLNHLKHRLFTGLLIVVPIGMTIFILRFLFNFADGFCAPAMRKAAEIFLGEGHYFPGVGVVAGLIVLYLAGLVTTNLFGRRLIAFGDRLLGRIPFVKSIYTSSKQLTEVLSKGGRENFRSAVWIEFPLPGTFAIAFVTNSVASASGKKYSMVFVPTSPNPTSGYVLLVEEAKVYPAAFGVEEAMKIVMSGGMVAPEKVLASRLQ